MLTIQALVVRAIHNLEMQVGDLNAAYGHFAGLSRGGL